MLKKLKQKFNNLTSDRSFSEILTGSAFALVAQVVSAVLALVISLLVARAYGAEATGILAIVQSFMLMVSIFAILGTNVSILRLIPEHIAKYSVSSAFMVYRKTQYLVALVALIIGGLFFCGADLIALKVFSKHYLSFYIVITALCVLFRALMDLNTQAIRGLRLIRIFAVMQVLPHFLMLVILVVAMLFSRANGDPVYAQLAAWGLTAVIGVGVMDRSFRQHMKVDDRVENLPLRQLLSISMPMLMTASMNFIVGQAGLLVLGMFRPSVEVGHYSIAVKLATLTTFFLQAINSMAAPKFSELFHTGKLDELLQVAKKSTRLIFWTTIPILIVLVVLGKPVLALFGEGFTEAYVPMLILLVGQFVNSVSGSTGYFMNMTGHQNMFRNIIAVASIVNLGFCFVLIPMIGALGAAISATLCLVIWNGWILIYIKIKYGQTIGYISLPKFIKRKVC